MGRLVKVLVKGIQMSVGPSVLLPQALLWDQFQSIQALEVLFILIVTVKLTPPTPDFLRSFLTFPKIQGQTTFAVAGRLVPMLVTLENCCLFQEPQPLSLSLFGISKSPWGAFSREILPDRAGDFSSLPIGHTFGYNIITLCCLQLPSGRSWCQECESLPTCPDYSLGQLDIVVIPA